MMHRVDFLISTTSAAPLRTRAVRRSGNPSSHNMASSPKGTVRTALCSLNNSSRWGTCNHHNQAFRSEWGRGCRSRPHTLRKKYPLIKSFYSIKNYLCIDPNSILASKTSSRPCNINHSMLCRPLAQLPLVTHYKPNSRITTAL
jgi:hypothetical protein